MREEAEDSRRHPQKRRRENTREQWENDDGKIAGK
jgi:hypothetical protein